MRIDVLCMTHGNTVGACTACGRPSNGPPGTIGAELGDCSLWALLVEAGRAIVRVHEANDADCDQITEESAERFDRAQKEFHAALAQVRAHPDFTAKERNG